MDVALKDLCPRQWIIFGNGTSFRSLQRIGDDCNGYSEQMSWELESYWRISLYWFLDLGRRETAVGCKGFCCRFESMEEEREEVRTKSSFNLCGAPRFRKDRGDLGFLCLWWIIEDAVNFTMEGSMSEKWIWLETENRLRMEPFSIILESMHAVHSIYDIAPFHSDLHSA